MKDIQLLIDMKVSLGRETLLFQILGKYGDKIPQELQEELRKWAEEERNIGEMKKRTLKGVLE
ncbi:MAG TPA: hypothetical protein VK982_12380 [Bacteroidales bacterium]|nr:hypothetical protein [Bacteroidales bacterium]